MYKEADLIILVAAENLIAIYIIYGWEKRGEGLKRLYA